MAIKFAVGTQIKQLLPAPQEGVVSSFVFDETSGDIHYQVTDANGQVSTWMENDIEEVPS